MKILGLDLGSHSIGWALLQSSGTVGNYKIESIINSGVRVVPQAQNIESGAAGSETPAAQRRIARMARRMNMRYKLRRKDLRKILAGHNMLPDTATMTVCLKKSNPTYDLYKLRVKALHEEITLVELGRILLLLNQHRGFKSTRKDQQKENDKALGIVEAQMSAIEQEMKIEDAETIGELFVKYFEKQRDVENWRNTDEPTKRIRGPHVRRSLYEKEFDLIWDRQKIGREDILTGSAKEYSEILALPFGERKKLLEKFSTTLYYQIKHKTIYYQRRLKSAKRFVAKCRFEPYKRVAPKSSPLFQEFRVWADLSRIKITDEDKVSEFLTKEQKEKLAEKMYSQKELTLVGKDG
jgi:CRISPR-associated endonuclease Csn1